jgi:hypothetical protein
MGVAGTKMVIVSDWVAVVMPPVTSWSITSTVNGNEPVAAGAPEIVPPEERDRPGGRVLPSMTTQLSVPPFGPPEAESVCEYSSPIKPAGKLVVVMETGVLIRILSVCCALSGGCPAWSASTVKLYSPPVVGVPEMVPSDERSKPGGRVLPAGSDQTFGFS